MPGDLLLLGGDGFIGRHIAFRLRSRGYRVLCVARRPERLRRMGFDAIRADLTDPATHDPGFWAEHLRDGTHVICAAGLLTGSERAFEAVHVSAPGAVYGALSGTGRAVLISAVGLEADTRFARYRRSGEQVALSAGATILRPGLVLGDTAYGGSALARALAVAPWAVPVVGDGDQVFNPMHGDDLADVIAECLENPPPPGAHDIGGPQRITQSDMLHAIRAWMGLPKARTLRLALPVAGLLGRIGDMLKLGPVSRTSVTQLATGVEADESTLMRHLTARPRGFDAFALARPPGTQDLWHARLYLLKPLVRLSLALLWLASGLLGLLLPASAFLPLVPDAPVPDSWLIFAARAGGLVDLAIALALMRAWHLRALVWVQAGMVAAYTLAFTLLAPALWLLPLGGLLKNLPVLVLIAIHGVLEDER